MKNLKFTFLIFCLFSLLSLKSQIPFSVCVNNDTTLLTKIDKLAEFVGKQHNFILDEVYNILNNNPLYLSNQDSLICNIRKALISSFENLNYLNSIDNENIKNLCTNTYFKLLSTSNIIDSLKVKHLNDSIINNSSFSQNFANLYEQLISYTNNQCSSLSQYYHRVDSLNHLAIKTLNNKEELFTYMAAARVATYSTSYWFQNLSKWVDLFNNQFLNASQRTGKKNPLFNNQYEKNSQDTSLVNTKDPYKSPILYDVKAADAGGAAGGAVIGGAVGSLGAGVGFFVGAAAGAIIGSATTSTGKVVENVWKHFFGHY